MPESVLLATLFPSRGRRNLLRALFGDDASGCASELGRRAGVSPKTALLVLKEFVDAGLATCEGVGTALVFRRADSEAGVALAALLRHSEASVGGMPEDPSLESALTYFGAPLLRAAPKPALSLEETLATASKRSRDDSTMFRVLPAVLARNEANVDWALLNDLAHRRNSKAEVGLVVDLTAELLNREDLRARARTFRDARRRKMQHYFAPHNVFEDKLARAKTPETARRWRFWLNMDLATLRSTVERHGKVSR